MNLKYPASLICLATHLKKLPGVGKKTSERFAFEMLGWSREELDSFQQTLKTVQEEISPCKECGCLSEKGVCPFCTDPKRDSSKLCIIGSPRDVFAIEATHAFRGAYLVIEHLLSPLDGRHAHLLRLDRIEKKIEKDNVQEMILAFDATLEGDTTALFLQNHFSQFPISISRLAFGIPIGSSLDYIDEGTLARAMQGRRDVKLFDL